MGSVTRIEWCDHTFNPWWGCTQVSPLCDHCYAMMLDARWHRREHWGVRAPRRTFEDAHWRQPMRWNSAAQAAGLRRRVFCASMADVFDNEVDQALRDRAFRDHRAAPDRVQKLLLGHQAAVIFDEVAQHLEGLRPQSDVGTALLQRAAFEVQREIGERVDAVKRSCTRYACVHNAI